MKIINKKDALQASQFVCEAIINLVNQKPDALLCFATGTTTLKTFELLFLAQLGHRVDFSETKFVLLDEWVGLDQYDQGSCSYDINKYVFKMLDINPKNIKWFNAKAYDLERECLEMDQYITRNGGIDLVVLGVGMNGHLALNEPNTPFDQLCHVVELDESTKTVGQKYFTSYIPLEYGITIGLKHLYEAKEVYMMALGEIKRDIIKQIITSPKDISLPASIMKDHHKCYFVHDLILD